jgi:hypothetical protein
VSRVPWNQQLLRIENWIDLIATCKQLVWSIRIGRNMPIWVLLSLVLLSGCRFHGSRPDESRYPVGIMSVTGILDILARVPTGLEMRLYFDSLCVGSTSGIFHIFIIIVYRGDKDSLRGILCFFLIFWDGVPDDPRRGSRRKIRCWNLFRAGHR